MYMNHLMNKNSNFKTFQTDELFSEETKEEIANLLRIHFKCEAEIEERRLNLQKNYAEI